MTESELLFRLTDEEYQEFICWFSYKFYRGRSRERITLDLSNLKAETQLQMESWGIHIQSGHKNLKLLYSVIEKLDSTEHLILFFAWKEFWAVPKRVLGDETAGQAWFEQLKKRCESDVSARMPLMQIEDRCRREGIYCRCYTRTVDQVLEAYEELGKSKRELLRLREMTVFPYRYAGVQALVLEADGIYEYGERSAAIHRYDDLERAVYSDMCLYLMKGDGEELLVPLDCLGDGENIPAPPGIPCVGDGTESIACANGVKHFLTLCNEKRQPGQPALYPEKLEPFKTRVTSIKNRKKRYGRETETVIVLQPYKQRRKGRKAWTSQKKQLFKRRKKQSDFRGIENPVSGYILIGAAALLTAAIAVCGPQVVGSLRADGKLDFFYKDLLHWRGESFERAMAEAEAERARWEEEQTAKAEKYEDGSGIDNSWKEQYMITVPDNTVFDQVGEDGTYVSSSQFFSIKLPLAEWEKDDFFYPDDKLDSSWGEVAVRGDRNEKNPYMMVGRSIPKTKQEYLKQQNDEVRGGDPNLPDITEYSYKDAGGCVIVRMELPEEEGWHGYLVKMSMLSPEYDYEVTIELKNETQENIEKARAALDTFCIVDTSTGICHQMEEETFHGYYGTNVVMTSCLVRLERDMTDDEIGECLEQVKDIDRGFLGARDMDALAVRREGIGWLGIDSPSLQENCFEENARKVSEIFQSEVILYDEFDGDLLMVAYSDREQKNVYQRATANDKLMLIMEFSCFGEEQKFPEDLLKYMDLTKEEAVAIWEGQDSVFQIEKLEELAGHMTKMPVPKAFIGYWGYEAFGDGYEVIRR